MGRGQNPPCWAGPGSRVLCGIAKWHEVARARNKDAGALWQPHAASVRPLGREAEQAVRTRALLAHARPTSPALTWATATHCDLYKELGAHAAPRDACQLSGEEPGDSPAGRQPSHRAGREARAPGPPPLRPGCAASVQASLGLGTHRTPQEQPGPPAGHALTAKAAQRDSRGCRLRHC